MESRKILGVVALVALALGAVVLGSFRGRDAPRGRDCPVDEQRFIRTSQDIDPGTVQVEYVGAERTEGADGAVQEVRFRFTNRGTRPVGHIWIAWRVVGDQGGPTSESRASGLVFAAETQAETIQPGQSFEMPPGTGKALLEKFLPPGPPVLEPRTIYCDAATNADVDQAMGDR